MADEQNQGAIQNTTGAAQPVAAAPVQPTAAPVQTATAPVQTADAVAAPPTAVQPPAPTPSFEIKEATPAAAQIPASAVVSTQTPGQSSGQIQPTQPGNTDAHLQQINREFKEKEAARKARESGLSYINISVTPINPDLLRLIPPEIAKSALILPFFRLGKKLRLAVADPENAATKKVIDDFKNAGYAVNINMATDDGLLEAMRLYQSEQYKVKQEIDTSISEDKIKAFEQEIKNLKDLAEKIKTINSEEANYLLNAGAYKTGASDIHYEPREKEVRVRFRIDGMLHDIFKIEKSIFVNIANQIKYQCKMKLNIVNEPQDGRYSFVVNERKIDVRVSALPTEYGETFVSRLLDSSRHVTDFEDAGFSGSALAHVQNTMKIKNGMILITGPTGSGKTTTLYTFLEKFNKPEVKIITLEDPIEYHMEGISQSPVNEKRGYDFANGLRSILRQDPDIVMLGEIRDLETAETATQAALTGHILLSTLHTNSAIEAIPRLVNIGLPPFMVAPALDTVIAQRLARKFCPKCTSLKTIAKSKLDELVRVLEIIKKVQPSLKVEIPEKLPLSDGCEICSGTGYKGRIALVEVLDVDNEIKGLILEKSSSIKIMEAARRKGMMTMYEDGILKVIKGETSLTEVRRVTSISV